MSWHERTALITGASRGIGRAIAERLAASGLQVGVNYRQDEEAARRVVDGIRAAGGRAEMFQADVSRPDEAQGLVEAVQARFGSLDVLVNNAGITRDTLLLRMHPAEWDAVIATNLNGVFYCTKAALKTMARQRFGRIVTISSVTGLIGNVGQANYAAAKAGVIGFTKAVAREWARRGVTANCVAPGLIVTDLSTELSEAQQREMIEHIPLGRLGRPEEVAEAVWFLVQADYVTGHVLVVDGGLAMR